jgi:hypothetical protein
MNWYGALRLALYSVDVLRSAALAMWD